MQKASRFVVPIYGGQVIRCTTRKAFRTAAHRLNFAGVEPDDRSPGLCHQYDLTSGSAVYMIGWFNRKPETLVHECVHCSQFILVRAGIDPRDSDGETMAYLTGYLFDRMKTR